jgi:Zn-dependent peptidase ImmA (M78 family)/formiminotetrahydrofolate cyclodeaminase
MQENLLNISVDKLLTKFGAGSHKPGSGSAAAFQGMISAKLLVTVISLTNEPKRRDKYSNSLASLLKMQSQINDRIFPELEELFLRDSVQFEKTINMRKLRDNEQNPSNKNQLNRKALEELKVSIQIPIKIANLCIEISQIAEFVFDNAFRGARGDSQVAFSGAVAALAGCVSIIQLNLLSFGSDEYHWTKEIAMECNTLKIAHDDLNFKANLKIEILKNEVEAKASFYKEIDELLARIRLNTTLTNSQIENSAIALQNLIWKNRTKIWEEDITGNPTQVLKPSIIFRKALGYHFDDLTELDFVNDENGISETAGIIDQENKIVHISSHLPQVVQNFTAAHELGHAILHKQAVMHRDIPLDGSISDQKRNKEEMQADKFASYFLMPAKQVKQLFEKIFLTEKFFISQDSTYSLTKGNISNLRRECKNLRGLSRKLASTGSYGNEFFLSMANTFNVSDEAMAIRLEELGLLEY